MGKYPCLVLDHDDTLVQSESTVNYPAFLKALEALRPGQTVSLRDFSLWTFQEGFTDMCVRHFGFTQSELDRQYEIWLDYVMTHTPPCFPEMAAVLRRQRESGGLICVVSHSARENILRDYQTHFGIRPDCIYGWELGPQRRKPAPYPLDQIMRAYSLSPSELLVVDDMKSGFDMAKARSVPFAWAGWGRQNLPEVTAFMKAHCDFSFHTPAQLEHFLFD